MKANQIRTVEQAIAKLKTQQVAFLRTAKKFRSLDPDLIFKAGKVVGTMSEFIDKVCLTLKFAKEIGRRVLLVNLEGRTDDMKQFLGSREAKSYTKRYLGTIVRANAPMTRGGGWLFTQEFINPKHGDVGSRVIADTPCAQTIKVTFDSRLGWLTDKQLGKRKIPKNSKTKHIGLTVRVGMVL